MTNALFFAVAILAALALMALVAQIIWYIGDAAREGARALAWAMALTLGACLVAGLPWAML